MKIVFILEGGFSEIAEAIFGFKTEKCIAKFKSGQCVIIYKEDEGIIWKFV